MIELFQIDESDVHSFLTDQMLSVLAAAHSEFMSRKGSRSTDDCQELAEEVLNGNEDLANVTTAKYRSVVLWYRIHGPEIQYGYTG